MAAKETFTDDEWADLQWALMLAGSHVTASDYPGLWKGFKEAAGGSRFLMGMQASDSELVAALCRDQARKRPPDIIDRDGLASDLSLDRIRAATSLVKEKAPDDLESFQWLLTGLAVAVAEEVDGTSPPESAAIRRVRAAVGLPDE